MVAENTHKAATVFLVDDQPGTVGALSRLLRRAGYQVRAFLSLHDFLANHDIATPGCAVLEFAMPGLSGLALQDALARSGNQRPIVFISRSADVSSSVQAMKRGAVDFLTRPISQGELLAAVHCAIERDHDIREIWTELRNISARVATLTPREVEVFHYVVTGRLNKQIAADLGTVEKTVKVHRSNIMKKMGASSLADLIRMAVQVERIGEGYSTTPRADCRKCRYKYAQLSPIETAMQLEIGAVS
jgi:FixJ family two-component response regulator